MLNVHLRTAAVAAVAFTTHDQHTTSGYSLCGRCRRRSSGAVYCITGPRRTHTHTQKPPSVRGIMCIMKSSSRCCRFFTLRQTGERRAVERAPHALIMQIIIMICACGGREWEWCFEMEIMLCGSAILWRFFLCVWFICLASCGVISLKCGCDFWFCFGRPLKGMNRLFVGIKRSVKSLWY